MTDEIEKNEDAPAASGDAASPQPATRPRRKESNPFDYPFVFPAMLLAFGLWFGRDGWFNPKIESVVFNQVMCVIFAIATVWTSWVDWRVMKKRKQKAAEQALTKEQADEQPKAQDEQA